MYTRCQARFTLAASRVTSVFTFNIMARRRRLVTTQRVNRRQQTPRRFILRPYKEISRRVMLTWFYTLLFLWSHVAFHVANDNSPGRHVPLSWTRAAP